MNISDTIGNNVVIIAASGSDEDHLTEIQRTLAKAKIPYKTVATESGLVNGWKGNGWGHYFAVDAQIANTLGSDFDALVIVGGERGVAKLKGNLHTRRIVNHFLEARKPISAISDGVVLLTLSEKSAGHEVSAPAGIREEIIAAGMKVSSESLCTDGNIFSADGGDVKGWAEATAEFFSMNMEMEKAA